MVQPTVDTVGTALRNSRMHQAADRSRVVCTSRVCNPVWVPVQTSLDKECSRLRKLTTTLLTSAALCLSSADDRAYRFFGFGHRLGGVRNRRPVGPALVRVVMPGILSVRV